VWDSGFFFAFLPVCFAPIAGCFNPKHHFIKKTSGLLNDGGNTAIDIRMK